ncbi:MAG: hypothetical protein GXP27_08290 [Planctomycetes bacterium]|nr:hypothetical protein [Planctomycetota bacterium]
MADSSAWADVIRRIHDGPVVVVLAVTGGGSGAIAQLLSVPGASRTVLEARVPYAHSALVDWLKWSPEQDCSRRTALAMAAVAWRRANDLTASDSARWANAVRLGVACTAALASDRPKRGDHRCWVAAHGLDETRVYGSTLVKGARTRPEEEEVATALVLKALAEAAGIRDLPAPMLLSDEEVRCECQSGSPLLKELAAGRRSIVWRWPDGRLRAAACRRRSLRQLRSIAFWPSKTPTCSGRTIGRTGCL